MSRTSISFVICAYNDVAGVARHFDYFIRQGQPVELVIVDDCSTDGLEQLVLDISLPAHIDLRFYRNLENRGPGVSRNTGMSLVTTDRVMFLDADDLLADSFFNYLQLTPLANGADFVLFKYHLCSHFDRRQTYNMHTVDNQFFSNLSLCSFPNRTFSLGEIPSVLRTINFPWNKVYRTDFIRQAGISFPDFRMHEDIMPHWASFLRAGRFGILQWAPPLIHHFEAPKAGRATNYVGEHRMKAFETLLDVRAEISAHPLRDLLLPELITFSENLVAWIISNAPQDWGQRYGLAAIGFFDKLGRGQSTQGETGMGQVLE